MKRSNRSWYKLLLSSFGRMGFYLVDPCMVQVMVSVEIVAIRVVHVDDIKIKATKEITDSVVADVNKRFPTKHLGEVTWDMGSQYKRNRAKGTVEIVQTQLIQNTVERLGIAKTNPIPASPSLNPSHV